MSGLHRGPIISKQTVFIDYTIVIFSKEAIIYEYLNSHYYTLLLLCTILAKYIQMLQNPVKNKESKETHTTITMATVTLSTVKHQTSPSVNYYILLLLPGHLSIKYDGLLLLEPFIL